MSNSTSKDAHAQPRTGADIPAISELESRHTNACRNEAAFRAVVDKYGDISAKMQHPAARRIHSALVFADANQTLHDGDVNAFVTAQLETEARGGDMIAAQALAFWCDPNQQLFRPSGATKIALETAEIIVGFPTPDDGEWREPLPLGNALLPVPALPLPLIPEPLRDSIKDSAERVSCPLDYIAVASLVALASLVGNTVCIRPKRCDDWLVVPNLWGALVGNPSVKKSPAVAEGLKPLSRLKAQAIEKHKDEMRAWASNTLLDELDADTLKSELKKRQKAGATREQLRAHIEEQTSDGDAQPTLKTYSVQDSTIEALAVVLERNPRGFLMQRDELSGWIRALGKQGHEQDRAFYIEAFSGDATNQQFERVGRGTTFVSHLTLSILGTIQPLPFVQLIRAAASGGDADGFVARFQMLVCPDVAPYKHVDRHPDTPAKNRAFKIFEALDALTPESAGAEFDGKERPFLRFSAAGQTVFDDWIIDLETRLPNLSPLIQQHVSKYRSLMPSLALLFHLIAVADGTAKPGRVSEKAAMMAAEWCEFLEAHARRIYAMASDGATDGAELIAQRFGQLDNPFTARDVHQKRWMGLTERADVDSALARLEDRGWIRPQLDAGISNRPTVRFWKHPAKAGEK